MDNGVLTGGDHTFGKIPGDAQWGRIRVMAGPQRWSESKPKITRHALQPG